MMMKAIITGMNGTVAPVLAAVLQSQGYETTPWNRALVPPEDEAAGLAFLEREKPDWICHLALGSERWAEFLAQYAKEQGLGFLFTSTVMVFSNRPDGPHRVGDERTSQDDYGRYKIRCEDQIQAVSDEAIIARIGWQIGRTRGGNNMFEALHQMHEKDEVIRCSTLWTPATSFLEDTCEGLFQLMKRRQGGVYHLDSNASSGLNYFEIVQGLKSLHHTSWVIEPDESYAHDQRMVDERIELPSLRERLA